MRPRVQIQVLTALAIVIMLVIIERSSGATNLKKKNTNNNNNHGQIGASKRQRQNAQKSSKRQSNVLSLMQSQNITLEFTQWSNKFRQNIKNATENSIRKNIWSSNQQFTQNFHNHHPDAKFTMNLNNFSDWTPAEIAKLGGSIPVVPPKSALVSFRISLRQQLPSSFDWRNSNALSSVKYQGQCGCCYSFSGTDALQSAIYLKYGNMVDLSEQQIVDCSTSQGNHGCNGGSPYYVFTYASQLYNNKTWLSTLACYNFTSGVTKQNGVCQISNANSTYLQNSTCLGPKGNSTVAAKYFSNETNLLTAVATIGPISVLINATLNSFILYSGGIYNDLNCTGAVNHAVLVVGYGVQNGTNYWIIKNSWGTGWGMNGYAYIQRGINLCSIASYCYYPTV